MGQVMSEHVYKWPEIADRFSSSIVLGNGASMALDKCFGYRSLFEEAIRSARISENVEKLFQKFKTSDFEFVLRMIWNAHHVNETFGIKENVIVSTYNEIRESLIRTVQENHVDYSQAAKHLPSIANFLKGFETVICLNYDLLVYWAMLYGNNVLDGYWFKDCFIGNQRTFKDDYSFLRKPHKNLGGATLVFYPHGSLILATDFFGQEVKICSDDCVDLLNTIVSRWGLADSTPLFVSEGTPDQKFHAIHRNGYLRTVYNTVLAELGCQKPVAIYGWSISEQDIHLLSAIGRNRPTHLAVSVYLGSNNWQDFCRYVRQVVNKTYGFNKTEIMFYDSNSPDCWINCKGIG